MASKEAANILKTELYLWLAKRAGKDGKALAKAKEAIDNILLSSFVLENNCEDAFRKDDSKEIILSIYFDITEDNRPTVRSRNIYGCNFINNSNAEIGLNGSISISEQ